MEEKIKKIDVHHHFTPREYVNKLSSVGITESYGQSFPKWTPKTSLAYMKKLGFDTAVMSVSTPYLAWRIALSKNAKKETRPSIERGIDV